MKKLFCIIIASLLLTSCTRDKAIDSSLLEKADEMSKVPTAVEADEYMGDFLPETEYRPGDITSTAGIWYSDHPMAESIGDGMFISQLCTFQSHIYDDHTSSGTAYMTDVINLETGNDRFLCTDPLCDHNKDFCPYVNLNPVGYYNGALYLLGFDYYDETIGSDAGNYQTQTVRKVDPVTGEFTDIAGIKQRLDSDTSVMMINLHICGNQLVYTVQTDTEDMENRTESRTQTLHIVDLDTGKAREPIAIPQELTDANFGVCYMDEDYLFCSDSVNGFYRTDHSLGNMQKIGNLDRRTSIHTIDTNTGEIFVPVSLDSGTAGHTCSEHTCKKIGRLTGNEIEILDMPHDNIIDFQVTRDWIYYTVYDPVPVGSNRRGDGEVYFYDGGKIYRTPRSTHDSAELIFSDGVNFNMINEWFVLGDCLYFSSWQRNEDGVGISFGRYVKTVRINLADHTARYFRFE